MTALHTLGVAEVAALVQRREVSPVEVVTTCPVRLETLEPRLRGVTVNRQGALAALTLRASHPARRQSCARWRKVGLKDIIYTVGLARPSAHGSMPTLRRRTMPLSLCDCQAGAIILGKTVTTEFATADPSPTRNPWNTETPRLVVVGSRWQLV